MEVESEGIQLQVKGHHQTWQATPGRQERGMEPPRQSPQRKSAPPTLWFQSSGLQNKGEYTVVVWPGHTACGIVVSRPEIDLGPQQ